MTEGPVLLVDGNNVLVRSVRAMQATGLSADGVATGPLMSFINSMAKYAKEHKPSKVVVCWDGGRSAYRTEIFPEYKAGRAEQPDEAKEFQHSAFALAKEFLSLANLHHVQVHGFEADDLIARYWHMSWIGPLYIISGDKDLLQLVTEDCTQVRIGQADEIWTPERVVEEMGCTPAQWADVLTLAGDSSDGVPGVPRVGAKTACKDLAKVGWNLHRLVQEGPDRYREHAERIWLNQKLVNLRDHLPTGLHLQEPPAFEPTGPDSILWDDLLAFLDRLKLASIGSRMRIGNFWT